VYRGAGELAHLIREREVSAREVVEQHIARIEAVDGRLNALVVPLFEQARAEAATADTALRRGDDLGPLHGVPITINLLGFPAGVVAATRVRPGEETDRPVTRDRVERALRDSELGPAGLPVGVQVVATRSQRGTVRASAYP
jgi:Asp-tRNA(Asn)/Glu-tRNA(Gln) amidotransferase A subunit family amidase